MNNYKLAIIMISLGCPAALPPAHGQAVYRCAGNSYSQQPCPGGTAVEVEDARSAAQREQTSAAAQRDAKTAKAMEEARLKAEAKAPPAYTPPAKGEPPAAEPAKPDTALDKPTKGRYFTAVEPRKPGDAVKKKKKPKKTASQAT